jgi:hypothetical protein
MFLSFDCLPFEGSAMVIAKAVSRTAKMIKSTTRARKGQTQKDEMGRIESYAEGRWAGRG